MSEPEEPFIDAADLGSPPRCAECLVTLEPEGPVELPVWRCPACGVLAL